MKEIAVPRSSCSLCDTWGSPILQFSFDEQLVRHDCCSNQLRTPAGFSSMTLNRLPNVVCRPSARNRSSARMTKSVKETRK